MSESNILRVQTTPATGAAAPEAPAGAAAAAKPVIYKVEMDDRCMVFPDGKTLQHLLVSLDGGKLTLEAVFAFNASRIDPRLLALPLEDARELTRELVGAVYQDKTGFYLSDEWKTSINVVANGYQIDIAQAARRLEIFLSSGVIWRFIKSLLMTLY